MVHVDVYGITATLVQALQEEMKSSMFSNGGLSTTSSGSSKVKVDQKAIEEVHYSTLHVMSELHVCRGGADIVKTLQTHILAFPSCPSGHGSCILPETNLYVAVYSWQFMFCFLYSKVMSLRLRVGVCLIITACVHHHQSMIARE